MIAKLRKWKCSCYPYSPTPPANISKFDWDYLSAIYTQYVHIKYILGGLSSWERDIYILYT